MHKRNILSFVVFLLLLAMSATAGAADIASRDEALDRLAAQVIGERSDVGEILGNPELLAGPVEVLAGGLTLRLGSGPGWLFAIRLEAGETAQYLVCFVGEDATVQTRRAKAAPEGLIPVSLGKATAAAAPGAVSSRDEAYRLLLDELLGHSDQGRRIHAAGAKVEAASVAVPTWRGEVTVDGGPGWLFFVDDVPQANWTHPCRYVLVGEDGRLNVEKAHTPPRDMDGFEELTDWPEATAVVPALPAAPANAMDAQRQGTPAANRYAVIISGGYDADNNHVRYWNDCAYFYTTLMANGFLDANIYVIYADGTDPAVDRADDANSPLDLDGDGDADIGYSATTANISLVFDELAGKMGTDDILYIFTTDHGGAEAGYRFPYDTSHVVLWLWGGESITGDRLVAQVLKVTYKALVGIFEQCFSGGIVDRLRGPNRVLMSASRWWELSYSMDTGTYDEFSYYLTQALADRAKGDSNGDGIVTMEEAYLYALAHDSLQSEELDSDYDSSNMGEHPAYFSSPWDLGRKLALTGSETAARPPRYAGYVQTQTNDAYPSLGTAQGWHGDDTVWTLNLPFAFPLGGRKYASAGVSANGILYFNSADLGGANSVDGLKSGRVIAPLWDDLSTGAGGADIYVASTAEHVTVSWVAVTVADTRQVNVSVRLFPDGTFIFYYGAGNLHTSRVAQRDKTIGVSTTRAAHFALRNGASDLGNASALTFVPSGFSLPLPLPLLLLE